MGADALDYLDGEMRIGVRIEVFLSHHLPCLFCDILWFITAPEPVSAQTPLKPVIVLVRA